jgi:hypothetical protein
MAFYLRIYENVIELWPELAGYMYGLMQQDQIGLNPHLPEWPFWNTME